MTTAYSSLLGLALPVQGELAGQWGDTVNDYITKYLDASIAGSLSITADVTLTKTTGTTLGATSSQYAILTCSPASVNIVVTAPAAYKIYVVNNTSASYTVTIRGAGPTTGVVLSALEKAVVAWNGSDFFKVATSATDGVSTFSAGSTGLTPNSATAGAVTLAGTLAVANGGTGLTAGTSGGVLAYTATGTLASSAALAASALVIGGGAGAAPSTTTTGTGVVTALGVNTGSAGAFVVNGGALGTPASGTVTNLTGTASININGTVGATTPAAGSFTTLGASGQSSFGGVLQITGGGVPASGGGMELAGSASDSSITAFNRSLGTYLTQYFNALEYSFATSGTERMRLTSTGLGIGTSSPSTKLHVSLATAYVGRFAYDATYYTDIGYGGTNTVAPSNPFRYWELNGSEQMRLTSTGLGIGTSSPSASFKLDVTGLVRSNATTNGGGQFTIAKSGSAVGGLCGSGNWIGSSATDVAFFAETGNALTFYTNGLATERARIDTVGNLVVGASSAYDGTYRGIQAINTTGGDCAVFTTTGVSGTIVRWNKATSGDNQFIDFFTETSITARGSITYNRAGGLVAYNVTSDYRAKDISGPVTGSGALIDSVPVYMGKMKDATQERPMFIAHETPNYAHTGEKDAVDKDGKPVYQQMDASALIPVMWAEIQSLRKRLADAGI